MKTLRERAEEIVNGKPFAGNGYCAARADGERVLRELVEEIQGFVQVNHDIPNLADLIWHRFIGQKSPESIVENALCSQRNAPPGTTRDHDHWAWCEKRAEDAIQALRSAGLLREGA
jgi:hypothetical protein